jgi:AcrR family transcriptional regulator
LRAGGQEQAIPEPKTKRGQERRNAIVDVAAELMYLRGVRATGIQEIIDAAGAGKSQLYHYFSDKDDLAAAVLEVMDEFMAHP